MVGERMWLVRAKARLQHGGSSTITGSFLSPPRLPPVWMKDFISMETPWRGNDCPDGGATTPPVHSPPGVEAREGKDWNGGWIFFSTKKHTD